ncbi:MAG: DUF937 domain-containing protein [Synechococcus sp.]
MGLFDQVVNAIADPGKQASTGQLGGILNAVGQLASSQQADSSSTQQVMSVVGGFLRSSLQERRATDGEDAVQNLVQQFSGTTPNPEAVNALLSPDQQSIAVEQASQATGLNTSTIQSMLPMVVPLILNLLQSGGQNSNAAAALAGALGGSQGGQGNPVLNSFLDSDGDNDVDIADALSMAGRFMSDRQ